MLSLGELIHCHFLNSHSGKNPSNLYAQPILSLNLQTGISVACWTFSSGCPPYCTNMMYAIYQLINSLK